LSEFENVDISLALERPPPKVQFLVLERFLNEVKNEIISFAKQTEISDFVSIETTPAEVRKNPDVWFEFLLTVDWKALFSVMGAVSSIINIGTFLCKTFSFLRKKRTRKQIRKMKMDCTASVTLAVDYLKGIGAPMRTNQIKLVYLSKMLAYYCIAIFASPISNPTQLLVITTHIDGKVSNFASIAL